MLIRFEWFKDLTCFAFKLDTNAESNNIRFLTSMKEIKEININDYHLTPMDYYCHDSINLGKKIRLDVPFIEGKDRILASTVSHKIEMLEQETSKEESLPEETPSKKEEQVPEKGYTQISIFDEDDD